MDAGSHRHAVRALVVCAALAISLSGCETSSRPAPAATRPHRASIPAGFEPQAVAIHGAHRYWLLGTARCRATRCSLILRTTDAGRTFTKTLAPSLPSTTAAPRLQFADDRSGFAYVPGPGGAFFVTHDGGASWQRLVFGNGAGSRLLRTTDGGATWARAHTPHRAVAISWLGFGDARAGYALVQTGWDAAAKTERQQLWRTTDAGARWRAVRLR
jgi:photosystem II stability/assembly factor-like uncharacterized protein